MKLIAEYIDLMQAEDAALRLRAVGILTHISSRHSFVLSGFVTGTYKVGLWAVLDLQHDDATAYLNDEEHLVTSGLSEEDLIALEHRLQNTSRATVQRFLWVSGLAILTILLALYWIASH
ncbi:hypothetical protein GP5015_2029 [gamma proteobacterium HTCC5015]|nr:hypothetical protein GP5015_2029 [gamma proteobacterium HTCC5015]